jgi:hypothetical protein
MTDERLTNPRTYSVSEIPPDQVLDPETPGTDGQTVPVEQADDSG